MTRRSYFEMKMTLLEIMASGPQGQSPLMRRANLPWYEFRHLMHQLRKSGFVTNSSEEKWARSTWTLSEKGIEALGLWRRLSTLLGEEPLLKPVLMVW
jgi:predicted transcriptional regulator